MPLIINDAEVNPTIPQPQLEYIRHLRDNHKQYTRFFNALLIPQLSHPAFFRDLRAFRVLPTTVATLLRCNPDDPLISKEQRLRYYQDVTNQFLNSRFAHPWCRKAMAGMGNHQSGGWWGAEWSATGRRMSAESKSQQEKLHKLLVPVWVCFRNRMFPVETVVKEWWEQRQHDGTTAEPEELPGSEPEGDEVTSTSAEPQSSIQGSGYLKGYDSDLDEQTVNGTDPEQRSGSVATGILRLAAAGMLINSMPKMQRWKLKREMKKR